MSESKSKSERYRDILSAQPTCVLCGVRPSASIDHIPPKVMFTGRVAPEGFEFATCKECNNGSTEYDYLAGFFSRFANAINPSALEQQEVNKLLKTMRIRYPEILKEMGSLMIRDKRAFSRETGVTPQFGQLYSDLPVVRVPKALNDSMGVQAAKISKALHFKHSNVIVPINASIRFRWFTNANQLRGDSPLIDAVLRMVQPAGPIKRNRIDLRGQFDYRFAISPSNDIAVYACVFGKAFGFLSFLTFVPEVLDDMIENIRLEHGYANEGFPKAQWPLS